MAKEQNDASDSTSRFGLLATTIWQTSRGEEPSAEQWQKWIGEEKLAAYKAEAGSLVGSLFQYRGDCQIHMIYDPAKSWYPLTLTFVRDGKDVLALKAHLHSVFRTGNRKDVLYFADFNPIATGCALVAYDLGTGKQLWRTQLQGIGPVDHSKYRNSVSLDLLDGVILVCGYEAFGNYVEIVDWKTGKTIAHRVFETDPGDGKK